MTSPSAVAPPCQTRVVSAFEADGRVSQVALKQAAACVRASWPVVVPSETVYGLAALATDPVAVERVFAAKGRPSDNPLIVHVQSLAEAERLGASPSPLARQLAATHWPGPLTLVIDCRATLPWVTAGLDSLAVRCPAHPFFAALIATVGPLAAPSANRSGLPSPTRAAHAVEDMMGRVPLIIDGGPVQHGIESTVVDCRGSVATVLRPGSITSSDWEGTATSQQPSKTAAEPPPRAPGMKYRHYSPAAQVWLYPVGNCPRQSVDLLERDAQQLRALGARVGTLLPEQAENSEQPSTPQRTEVCHRNPTEQFAYELFDQLRYLDRQFVDCILVLGVSPDGLGQAVMDRLTRASSQVRDPKQASPFPCLPRRRQHDSPISEASEDP